MGSQTKQGPDAAGDAATEPEETRTRGENGTRDYLKYLSVAAHAAVS